MTLELGSRLFWVSKWMFPKNSGFSPQIIHFNSVFHYKPSILGENPYFWKYPNGESQKRFAKVRQTIGEAGTREALPWSGANGFPEEKVLTFQTEKTHPCGKRTVFSAWKNDDQRWKKWISLKVSFRWSWNEIQRCQRESNMTNFPANWNLRPCFLFWECCYESLEKITMNQSLITSDTVDANCVEQVGINNQQYHGSFEMICVTMPYICKKEVAYHIIV